MVNRLFGRPRSTLPSPTGRRSDPPALGLACPTFDYSEHRLAESFYACARSGVAAVSLSGERLRYVAVLKKSLKGPAFAASFAVDREIDNKITRAWRRRFTKTASCHALAMRVKAVDPRLPPEPGKAAGFMKSCGFFTGDISRTRVNQRRRDQLSVNRRHLRNKYAHECRV